MRTGIIFVFCKSSDENAWEGVSQDTKDFQVIPYMIEKQTGTPVLYLQTDVSVMLLAS